MHKCQYESRYISSLTSRNVTLLHKMCVCGAERKGAHDVTVADSHRFGYILSPSDAWPNPPAGLDTKSDWTRWPTWPPSLPSCRLRSPESFCLSSSTVLVLVLVPRAPLRAQVVVRNNLVGRCSGRVLPRPETRLLLLPSYKIVHYP